MAITSVGYDGTVDEVQWAKLHPATSSRPGIVNDSFAIIVTGATRTVRMPAGSWYGFGVYDTSDTNVDLVGTAVSSGTRWDTLVLRRDWTTNTSAFMLLAGTSTKAISASVQNNPGVVADQVLYLVRFDSALAEAQELADLREYGRTMMFFSDGASGFPDASRYLYGQPMLGRLGSSLGQDLGVKRSNGWDYLLARPWTDLAMSGSVASGNLAQYRVVGDVLELRGLVQPAGGGSFSTSSVTVATLATTLRPQYSGEFAVGAGGVSANTYHAKLTIVSASAATDAGAIQVKTSGTGVTYIRLDGVRISLS